MYRAHTMETSFYKNYRKCSNSNSNVPFSNFLLHLQLSF
ncbi:hypothetical protein NC652_038517 [Populus alba x Populus x berolinensis]|nr:hypothetical protein NC652_038517 [Populus alba x Populus x berolinensis]